MQSRNELLVAGTQHSWTQYTIWCYLICKLV